MPAEGQRGQTAGSNLGKTGLTETLGHKSVLEKQKWVAGLCLVCVLARASAYLGYLPCLNHRIPLLSQGGN